jgi:hypothetical protein
MQWKRSSFLSPWVIETPKLFQPQQWRSSTDRILAIMCSTLGRVSFIFLMLRLFGNTKSRRWFLYFLMAEQLIVNLFTCITIFTQCGNVHSLWDPVGRPSKCWSPDVQTDTGYAQGGNNSTTWSSLTLIVLQFSTQRRTSS